MRNKNFKSLHTFQFDLDVFSHKTQSGQLITNVLIFLVQASSSNKNPH